MKLRLAWIFISVIFMCFLLSPPAFSAATQCGLYKGDGWRCAKDNYQADFIKISNESTQSVSFKIGLWTSTCGKKGTEISGARSSLEPKGSINARFMAAKANQCMEMFIYDCSTDACSKVLSAHTL
jgi:hypothetical protein